MIYKVYYQENKDRSPRREQTKTLYVEVDATTERQGRIEARKRVEAHTAYNIEFIEQLSDQHLAYEKESGVFSLTEF